METAKQAFKKSFGAVRKFGKGMTTIGERAIAGYGDDGNVYISPRFSYDAAMDQIINPSTDDRTFIDAAVTVFAYRLWGEQHPEMNSAEKIKARRNAEDFVYEYF